MKSCLKHVFCETQAFMPFNQDRTHVLIVLLRAHFLLYLLSQLLLLLLFLHFFLIELFPSLCLTLHILSFFCFLLFSSFQVLNEDFALSSHRLNSLLLFLNCSNMICIEFSISFYLQKFISTIYFDKFFSCLIFLVAIRMIFQCQHSIVLLKKSEVTAWRSIKYFIRISIQFFNDLFKSLHLIRVIIKIQSLIRMAYYQWMNGIKQYIWPTQSNAKQIQQQQTQAMSHLARLKRLSQMLQNSVYSKTQQQQICMFYSSLIEQYPQSKCSKVHPQFLYEPPIYIPLLNIIIPIKVQTSQLYCGLQLAIVFQEEIGNNMPLFFIKNPDYTRFKPREKYVKHGKNQIQTYKYEGIFGGIKVIVPNLNPQRWDWSPQAYYKQQNIVKIVRWIHKTLLPDFFPFAKRKSQISTGIYQKSKVLKDFLDAKMILPQRSNDLQQIPLLQNIQSANTLSISIQSQIRILKQDISNLKDIINNSPQYNIKDFYPQPKDKKSQIILEARSSLEACKDVENEMQKHFLKGNFNMQDFKEGILKISDKKFEQLFILSYWKSLQLH